MKLSRWSVVVASVTLAAGLVLTAGLFLSRPAAVIAADDTKTPEANRGASGAGLPIGQIVLFSSGVGYFQREGTVEGNARVDLSFPTQDINDLLKSMVIRDLDGGVVSTVSYRARSKVRGGRGRRKSSFLTIPWNSLIVFRAASSNRLSGPERVPREFSIRSRIASFASWSRILRTTRSRSDKAASKSCSHLSAESVGGVGLTFSIMASFQPKIDVAPDKDASCEEILAGYRMADPFLHAGSAL